MTAAVKVTAQRPPMTGRLNVSTDTWETVWSHLHRVLVINLGIVVGNLPLLVALAVVDRPWQYPVFFGILAVGVGPSLAAAFGYLHDPDRSTVRDLVRAYRRFAGRAALRWAVTVALLGVLLTDIVALHDAAPGAVLVPLFAVMSILVLAVGVLCLALLPLHPELGLWRSLGTAAVAAVARCWLTLTSLGVLVAAATAVNAAPVLGLATVPGCAVFLTWANSQAALHRAGSTR